MRLRSLALSLLTVALVATSTTLITSSPASATTTRESRLIAKINDTRVAHGLRPLRVRSDLMTAAERHSRSMAGTRTLFHTASFNGLCCWSLMAENVGYGFSVAGLHQQFMDSAPHRANILNPRLRHVGVGIVSSGGALWVTEVFRDPR
jgi:uncharacterized protein YkwD